VDVAGSSPGRGCSCIHLGVLAAVFVAISSAILASPTRVEEPVASPESPSILLVVIDTLRRDYLGFHGFEGDISPNLDALARRSVVFDQALSPAPWTRPAVASLFTSLYPEQHGQSGVVGEGASRAQTVLPPDARTLAERLRSRGYATAAFVGNPWMTRGSGLSQGFELYDDRDVGNEVEADVLLDRAADWIETRPLQSPFFVYVHLMDVHGPYRPLPEDLAALRGDSAPRVSRPLGLVEFGRIPDYLRQGGGPGTGDPMRLGTWRDSYAAGVRRADRALGDFFSRLERAGALDRTAIVVTSDHGEELADHGGWNHGDTLFDEQVRIPLMIRVPGNAPARRVDRVVSLLDVLPTLEVMAGAAPPRDVMGADLGPLLVGTDLDRPDVVYLSGVKRRPELAAVRTADAKLILRADGQRLSFFDLVQDPLEQEDAQGKGSSVESVSELLGLARAERLRIERVGRLGRIEEPLDRSLAGRLRSLGYLAPEGEDMAGEGSRRRKPSPEVPAASEESIR
jgi:arylsulfatase A-like enzyme